MKLGSCPLDSMYCLKQYPCVHPALDISYYSIPATKHNFIQFREHRLDDFNIITPSPYLPTNAGFKTNISFWTRAIFLWHNAAFLQGQIQTWSIPWKIVPYTFKECSVHCQMSNPPFKEAAPPHGKLQYFCTIQKVLIIDTGHPFQKCNQYVWNCGHH